MYKSIEMSELKKLIGIINLIDIRENYIYRLGFIPTAKNIPSKLLLFNCDQYLKKENNYYIYCDKGVKSEKVCLELSKKGYKVVNIIGGYDVYSNKS